MNLAMNAAEESMRHFTEGDVLSPEKITQISKEETQERINCPLATFRSQNVSGVKWVSVFPMNPVAHGL